MSSPSSPASPSSAPAPANFIEVIIEEDLAAKRVGQVVTRFPPEPNGYLHLGHAKSIAVNFGLAEKFNGICRLRFDDTNPEKESAEYIRAIQEDIKWLGYKWEGEARFASSYFQQLYEWALHLIENGHAYVCELSPDEARDYRGTLTEPGRNSPWRDRPAAESLDLFQKMKAGEFAEGSRALRAKIDMASPNMNMRDPVMYRIRDAAHHQTGAAWRIYPTYDYAHGQGDAIEGVSHSVCTLEFEDHRPLYDWFLERLPLKQRPRQCEFGRLNPGYTVTSKRRLRQLVEEGAVAGWDDPRMPTLSGLRRRGCTPAAIRRFCEMIGTTKSDGVVDIAMLEHALRDDLNKNAPRAFCVTEPLRVVLTNWPEGHEERIEAPAHPERDELGTRGLRCARELWIEREDFREEANKKYKRLTLGRRVRLRNGYIIEASGAVKDADGRIVELRCRFIPDTLGKDPADGIKPRGVIHWLPAIGEGAAVPGELRLYDRLFLHESPGAGGEDFMQHLNPDSLIVKRGCMFEPGLAQAKPGQPFQFERVGYFTADPDHRPEAPVFNRTISLRDGWKDRS